MSERCGVFCWTLCAKAFPNGFAFQQAIQFCPYCGRAIWTPRKVLGNTKALTT